MTCHIQGIWNKIISGVPVINFGGQTAVSPHGQSVKKKKRSANNPIASNTNFQSEGRIDKTLDRQKLRELMDTRSALQEKAKGVPKGETKTLTR